MPDDRETATLEIHTTEDLPLAAALLCNDGVILVGIKRGPPKNPQIGRDWCTIELGSEDAVLLDNLVAEHHECPGGLSVPVKTYEQQRRAVLRAMSKN